MDQNEILLKYGCNPHQNSSRIYIKNGNLPIKVINGNPGYINFMDALNSWQLVHELQLALKIPAAASFKHVSPAGVGIGLPLNDALKIAYCVENMELSPLAVAYARARGADRISSYGDWIALSDIVDESVAKLIKREVTDGIIAPGYTKEALNILKTKRGGKFNIVEIDPDYEPEIKESRTIFGMVFEQKRNYMILTPNLLKNIVTQNKNLPLNIIQDMIISMITLKYTQSNSVCYVYNGQVIGCGAGQQSRIHCTRLAGDKADNWFLKQHPRITGLKFKNSITKTEKDITVDQFLNINTTEEEMKEWSNIFTNIPLQLSIKERTDWLGKMKNITLGSDAFFPQRDNIDRAYQSGVKYIVQPGGSIRDNDVIDTCNTYNMVMCFSATRLFHH